jgi:hypothetical protein
MVDAVGLRGEERALVAQYWWQRAAGEMTSWVGWKHVLRDLQVEGSPAPVLKLAERAVVDEWKHALWCRDFAVQFGHAGGDVTPRGERPLTLDGATERENRLARIALCCFTETVGCFTLTNVRGVLRDGAFRKQNQAHLADELQHSRTGWAHLSTLDATARAVLKRRLPELLALARRICCDGKEQHAELLIPFGYFTPELLASAHDEALREVILPGLHHVGILEAA